MMWFVIMAAAFWFYTAAFFCVVQKPLFGIVNRRSAGRRITADDVARVYYHGFVSDSIVCSYMSVLPLVIGFTYVMWSGFPVMWVLYVCIALAGILMGLLTVSDVVLYGYWQSKIDSSVFVYLRSLKGTTASVSGWYIAGAIGAVLLVAALFTAGGVVTCRYVCSMLPAPQMQWWGYLGATGAFVLSLGVIFILIRGLKIRPYNPSVVYYSPVPFFNHWALNPGYSIIYSLTTRDEFRTQFRNYPEEERSAIMDGLFPTEGTPKQKLLRTDRPNVVLVVWESFGAEFTGSLGDKPEVAREFDRIARDGVLFTRCRAGSFRTDRALVCLLSGYPGQPTTSVIRYSRKLANLPGLPRRFRDLGYVTTAVHGGDLTIMHKSDYYLASGHDHLICEKDMPRHAPRCKWGVHDDYVFSRVSRRIQDHTARGERFFITVQTLSSHEPFEVPYSRLKNPVDNSFAYTDHALGEFVDSLRDTPAWENLLLIVVGDHGINMSHDIPDRPANSHIPLMLAGGALACKGVRIDTLTSQTDIAATLLGQMGLDHSEFTFSRDVLADTYREPFSFHTYNNGFVLTDRRGTTWFDNWSDSAVQGADPERERRGKAIIQTVYDDLAEK